MKYSNRNWKLDWEKNKHQECPSRRDVLKYGLQSGVMFVVPSALSQLFMSKNAQAGAGFNNLYIAQLDLQNGYAAHGQFLPAVAGTINNSGLTTLGVTTSRLSAANSVDTRLGLPFFGTGQAAVANTPANSAQYTSKIMGGIVERGGTALANTRAAAILNRSADDTSANPNGMANAIIAGGLRGNITGNFGMTNSQSGLNAQEIIAGTRAAFASSVTDIENAAKIAGLTHLPSGSLNAMMNGVEALSQSDLAKLSKAGDREIQSLANATITKTKEFVTPPAGLDARQDLAARTAFNITTTTAANNRDVIIASLLSGLFSDHFGMVSLQLSGYDYHNTGLANTEALDLAAGRVIGNSLAYAAAKGKKFLLFVTTAGSVGPGTASATDPNAPRTWNGDRGTNGAILAFYYDPAAAPTQVRNQLGLWLPDGGASVTANAADPIQGDVRRAVSAAVANALMLGGRANMIDTLFPNMFTTAQKDQIRLFG